MEKVNGSGLEENPILEIEGKKYVVKFTRRLLYRMGKAGVNFAPQMVPQGGGRAAVTMPFTMVVDVLHMAIGYPGTTEDLAEAIYDIRNKAVDALMVAWGKAFPAPLPTLPETPADPQEAIQ
jgi:hypothetical protein